MGKKSDDKRSFKLYNDYINHVGLLSDEDAGRLFKAILSYANGQEVEALGGVAEMAFSFISAQMDRDKQAYDNRCEANRANGKKGGRPSKAQREEPENAGGAENGQPGAAQAVEDTGPRQLELPAPEPKKQRKKRTEPAYTMEFEEFWKRYPRKADKGAAFKQFNARLKEGHTAHDLCLAALRYGNKCRLQHTEESYIKHAKTFLGATKPFLEFLQAAGPQGALANAPISQVDEDIRNGKNPFL